jgi:membrane protein YdbS with pleckstrin-like domain
MPYPDSLLSRGEQVVLHKHPHWKSLIPPVLYFIVLIAAGFAVGALIRKWTYHSIGWVATAVIVVVLGVWLVVAPVLRWRTEHFVLTTHHVFFRTGIIRRRAHQIPLSRIQNIETVITFWGRMLGYGSLIVDSAADQPLEFPNVAHVQKVQGLLNQLIADDRARQGDDYYDGTSVPGRPTGRSEQAVDREAEEYPPQSTPGQRPTQAYPTQGYPEQGYPSQGSPGQGYPSQGYPNQGYPSQGSPGQGYPTPAYPTQQVPPGQPGPGGQSGPTYGGR